MPFNGSGTFTVVNTFVPNTTISSSAVNANFGDIATGLSDCLTRDGQAGMTAPLKAASGSPGSPSITFSANTTTGFRLSGNSVILVQGGVDVGAIAASPVGTVIDYAGGTAPGGWLLCYGQAVSRTTYALLFTAIGTTWGVGDGVTTFNVPDLRGRGTYGKDDMGGSAANRITNAGSGIVGTTLGAAGGGQSMTLSQANLPNYALTVTDPGHTHTLTNGTNVLVFTSGSGSQGINAGVNATPSTITVNSNTTGITVNSGGSGTAAASMNPAAIMNKIIFAGA
jgi:microcystin-dependent protein